MNIQLVINIKYQITTTSLDYLHVYFYVPLFIIIESSMNYWLTYTVIIMLRCQLLIRLRPQTPIQAAMMIIH